MRELIKDAPCLCKDDMQTASPKKNVFQEKMHKKQRIYQLHSDEKICEQTPPILLDVAFPSHLIMKEVVKDAPCLCKDDDMERLQPKRNFFQKMLYDWLCKRNHCYQYPVLYSDGTISKAECERVGRTPLGVIFENHVVTLHGSYRKMKWYKASQYCKNIKILGQPCEGGHMNFWTKYLEQKQILDAILKSLGGNSLKLRKGYWTSAEYGGYCAWAFGRTDDKGQNHYLKKNFEKYHVRPVLDLAKTLLSNIKL
ncbi:MAG: hypothetical protein Q4F75_03900 [Pseudomonadota bacterium]|nr:hypothetical protein [Pseudomonadota bacterium]